ncbi:hypothetical protein RFI_21144 [Reticulomyxa filosa]|uniref:Uncharacterized protein n=1 Tax=Reticulomyxa filosa TaxID=46433 RepID=X6MQD2_RETFI|nr:hypothetical protein RFI_21144 [Reticulomyxa filosa]|eukprot:ETO16213.1 hypothetical protein RFI_21144 [Reticulomyxa filosa]
MYFCQDIFTRVNLFFDFYVFYCLNNHNFGKIATEPGKMDKKTKDILAIDKNLLTQNVSRTVLAATFHRQKRLCNNFCYSKLQLHWENMDDPFGTVSDPSDGVVISANIENFMQGIEEDISASIIIEQLSKNKTARKLTLAMFPIKGKELLAVARYMQERAKDSTCFKLNTYTYFYFLFFFFKKGGDNV